MKQAPLILLLLVVLSFATFNATGQAPPEKRNQFLSVLKEGQPISLKEVQGRFEISFVEGLAVPQGYKIIEIGADFLIVQDITGINEIHIPLYSIKAITKMKLQGK